MYETRSSIKARPIKLIGFRPVSRNNASGSINISRRFWLLPRFPRPPPLRTAIATCTGRARALPSPAGSHCRRRIPKTLLFSASPFLPPSPHFSLRSASSGRPSLGRGAFCRDENDRIITRCAAVVRLRKSKSDTSVAHRYGIDFWITSHSYPTRYYKKSTSERAVLRSARAGDGSRSRKSSFVIPADSNQRNLCRLYGESASESRGE